MKNNLQYYTFINDSFIYHAIMNLKGMIFSYFMFIEHFYLYNFSNKILIWFNIDFWLKISLLLNLNRVLLFIIFDFQVLLLLLEMRLARILTKPSLAFIGNFLSLLIGQVNAVWVIPITAAITFNPHHVQVLFLFHVLCVAFVADLFLLLTIFTRITRECDWVSIFYINLELSFTTRTLMFIGFFATRSWFHFYILTLEILVLWKS